VKGHLSAVDGAIVRELHLDGDVEEHVVVGMDVEGQGDGEKRGGVKVEVDLAKMLEGG
jgi:hypothetical protein